ncbi:MAG: putative maltokinase, partial [Candidatus Binataceae bacterium]
DFPKITERPYPITLGPHVFIWFSVASKLDAGTARVGAYQAPTLAITNPLDAYLRGAGRTELERALVRYLPYCRWFRSKARNIRTVHFADVIPLGNGTGSPCLTLVNVEFGQSDAETYVLPLAMATDDQAREIRANHPAEVIAELRLGERNRSTEGVMFDAVADPAFARELLRTIERRRHVRSSAGEIIASSSQRYSELRPPAETVPRPLRAEQSNTSIVFGEKLILKLFRRLDVGINPDLEVGRFLTERASFANTPPVAGWIEYQVDRAEPRTLAIAQGYVANRGDAWEYTQRDLVRYYERAAAKITQLPPLPADGPVNLLDSPGPDEETSHRIGAYLESARLMGERVASLHLALVSDAENPEFAPEPYSALYRRSTYQSMRNQLGQVFRQLESRMSTLAQKPRPLVQRLLAHRARISECFEAFLKHSITVPRMRCHGDLHLGQILRTGSDFVIIDFEGEPARSLADRRRKRCGLRDVAGMLRSFHYAALVTLFDEVERGALGNADVQALEPWARLWHIWCSWAFLRGYLKAAGESPIVPADRSELRVLLDAFQMEKAIYEVGYELNNRPDWLRIPLHGIEQILNLPHEDGAQH